MKSMESIAEDLLQQIRKSLQVTLSPVGHEKLKELVNKAALEFETVGYYKGFEAGYANRGSQKSCKERYFNTRPYSDPYSLRYHLAGLPEKLIQAFAEKKDKFEVKKQKKDTCELAHLRCPMTFLERLGVSTTGLAPGGILELLISDDSSEIAEDPLRYSVIFDVVNIEGRVVELKEKQEFKTQFQGTSFFFCSSCGRDFKWKDDGYGNWIGWVKCECGQEVPVAKDKPGGEPWNPVEW